jgi:hypothetical protein
MTSGGVFDRLMRASVDRAQRMQPKRTQRVADELLYASPAARDDVAAIRNAAARLVAVGIMLPTVGAVALRRNDDRATVTIAGTDLTRVDNRSVESIPLADRRTPAMAGIRAGGEAAIHGFPTHVIALCDAGEVWDESVSDLVDVAGALRVVSEVDDIRTGLTVLRGRGVVSTHDDPVAAAARMEAAEILARMTIIRHTMRRRQDG